MTQTELLNKLNLKENETLITRIPCLLKNGKTTLMIPFTFEKYFNKSKSKIITYIYKPNQKQTTISLDLKNTKTEVKNELYIYWLYK